jgi:hypothetical protein
MSAFTDAELECLPDDVYRRIAGRDMEKEFYIERLELIIKSTWKDADSKSTDVPR